MREKLIKALDKTGICNAEYCCDCEFNKDVEGCVRRQKEIIADSLIANGVTIPVYCKHCTYFKAYKPKSIAGRCELVGQLRTLSGFCSYGERREGE